MIVQQITILKFLFDVIASPENCFIKSSSNTLNCFCLSSITESMPASDVAFSQWIVGKYNLTRETHHVTVSVRNLNFYRLEVNKGSLGC